MESSRSAHEQNPLFAIIPEMRTLFGIDLSPVAASSDLLVAVPCARVRVDLLPSIRREVYMILRNEEERHVDVSRRGLNRSTPGRALQGGLAPIARSVSNLRKHRHSFGD